MIEPVSATALLQGISQAVSATFTVTNTLIQIGTAIAGVDRSLQQLQQEVSDLYETMHRMGQDFSGPMGRQILDSNTGSLGNHWRAVLNLIERANRTLSEMESCLRRVPHNRGGNWSKPLRAAWLRFQDGDIMYYRNEIQILTRNMHFELTMVLVCRDMFGMSHGGAQGFQVNLISTEDQWRALKNDAAQLKSSSFSVRSAPSIRRKPTPNSSVTTLVPDGPVDPMADNEYLRQRQLETAKDIEDYLSTASELLSTASTVCGQPYRGSIGDEIEQSAEKRAAIMEYIQEQRPEERDNDLPHAGDKPTNIWIVFAVLPARMIGALFLIFVCYPLVVGLFLAYLCLWALAQLMTGFRNSEYYWQGLKKDISKVGGWYSKSWHVVFGLS